MQFLEGIWTAFTCLINRITLSPLDLTAIQQQPPLDKSVFNFPDVQSPLKKEVQVPSYPIFKPPTGRPKGDGSDFKCEYPNMKDWMFCSITEDRECWLRHRNGTEFNIHTDYEKFKPEGEDRFYEIDVVDQWINADGKNFTFGKAFRWTGDTNITFPGPWIQACWGDRVHIKVNNRMKWNGTSIHWHGIRQFKSMQMDGVNGVTECPIAPEDSFTYVWDTWQYGSSWYHSHYSVQYADGVQGPITIHGPSSAPYDEPKLPVLMTDWDHTSAFALMTKVPSSDKTILLNGIGNVNRFTGFNNNDSQISDPYQITFNKTDPKKPKRPARYLLRLINTSFDSTFIFSIDNHWLQIISADFVPLEPYWNTSVLIGIGQRYNVIVEASPVGDRDQNPIPDDGNFWIRTWVAKGCGKPGNETTHYEQTGILRYNNESKVEPTSSPWPKVAKSCSDETYSSLIPKLPWYVGKASNSVGGMQASGEQFDVFSKGTTKPFPDAVFSLEPNASTTFNPLQIDFDNPMFLNLGKTASDLPGKWVLIPENYTDNDWVWLVLTSPDTKTFTIAHPIHLHGHDFALLAQEENAKWPPANGFFPKLINPPRRDVVLLPSNGYVVIAFKADNPGAWLMHCHIARHAGNGLALQILERQSDARKLWPPGNPFVVEAQKQCNKWKSWVGDCKNWWPGQLKDGSYPLCPPAPMKTYTFLNDSGI